MSDPTELKWRVVEELRRASAEVESVLELLEPRIDYFRKYASRSERIEAGIQLRHALEQLDFVLERHHAVIEADPELAKQAVQYRAQIEELRKLLPFLRLN